MCATMVDIQSEIRPGKKRRRKKERKKQDKNIMSTSATQGGKNEIYTTINFTSYVSVTLMCR